MTEKDIIYENGGHYIASEGIQYIVYRHKGTHAESDCAFRNDADGLSLAKARVDYLARRHSSSHVGS